MKTKYFAVAIAALIGVSLSMSAFAWTCQPGDWIESECCDSHHTAQQCANGHPIPVTPPSSSTNTNSNSNSNSQGQLQGQGQGQGQDQNQGQVATGGTGVGVGLGVGVGQGGSSNATGGSVGDTSATSVGINGQQQGIKNAGNSNNRNTLKGGDQSTTVGLSNKVAMGQDASTRSSVDSSGNSQTNVDTSDHSTHNYSESYQFIPPVVPATPSSSLPSSQVSTVITACHGLTQVETEKVVGKYVGFFVTKDVDLGSTDRLVPYTVNGVQQYYFEQPQSDGSVKLWGTQDIVQTSVIGVSGGRSIAIGGGGSSKWGQAGGGSSSAMQRMVTSIQQMPCEIGVLAPRSPIVSSKKVRQ